MFYKNIIYILVLFISLKTILSEETDSNQLKTKSENFENLFGIIEKAVEDSVNLLNQENN